MEVWEIEVEVDFGLHSWNSYDPCRSRTATGKGQRGDKEETERVWWWWQQRAADSDVYREAGQRAEQVEVWEVELHSPLSASVLCCSHSLHSNSHPPEI